MKTHKRSLLIITIITAAWIAIGLNINLFYKRNFKTIILSDTYLYIHETRRGKSHFNIGKYSILCDHAVNDEGKNICDIEGIHRIRQAELIATYYKPENNEDPSESYLKSIIYEINYNDGKIAYHNFSVSDRQIEISKNQNFWSRKGIPLFLIFMNYIWLFLYILDNQKHRFIPIFTFYGIILIVFYFII